MPKCSCYLHLFFLVYFWFCYLSFVYLVEFPLFNWMPACVPTCLRTCLPDRLPTCLILFQFWLNVLSTYIFFLVFFWFCFLLFVYLVACPLFNWMPACLPTCLPTYLPAWSPTYLPDYVILVFFLFSYLFLSDWWLSAFPIIKCLRTCLPACLIACMIARLSCWLRFF